MFLSREAEFEQSLMQEAVDFSLALEVPPADASRLMTWFTTCKGGRVGGMGLVVRFIHCRQATRQQVAQMGWHRPR